MKDRLFVMLLLGQKQKKDKLIFCKQNIILERNAVITDVNESCSNGFGMRVHGATGTCWCRSRNFRWMSRFVTIEGLIPAVKPLKPQKTSTAMACSTKTHCNYNIFHALEGTFPDADGVLRREHFRCDFLKLEGRLRLLKYQNASFQPSLQLRILF